MNRFSALFVSVLSLAFLNSCRNSSVNKNNEQNKLSVEMSFPVKVKYAKHYSVTAYKNRKEVIVFDPWKGDTLGFYTLIQKGNAKPDTINPKSIVVQIPVSSVACLSSTHVGSMVLLGVSDKITGLSNGDKIWDKEVSQRFKEGKIVEVGKQMSNNIEQIISLSPDVLMKSGYDNVRSEDKQIAEAKIPIIYNIEWMEGNLLARAEWIKFVALFFGKDKVADSLFNDVEKKYQEAVALTQNVSRRPSVLFGLDYRDSWHMAGSESYVAKMLVQAGANFVPNGLKGTQPLNFEQVLEIHANDDLWLCWMTPNITSVEKLGKMNERYKLFKAFQNGEVYTHDKRLTPTGGNDFWESGVSRPDLLLKDLIKIIHPELLPDYETVYWRKLPLKESQK